MHDVVIVGAGPAGSTAARRCSSAGLDVLLLEKERLPRDKPCGGAVSLRFLDRHREDLGDLVLGSTNRVRIFLDYDRTGAMERSAAYFRRDELDNRLARMAVRAGARIRDGVRVRSLETDREGVTVITDRGDFRGRLVIGADGVNSAVRRSCGLERHRQKPDRLVCLVLETPVSAGERVRIFDDGDSLRHSNIYFYTSTLGYGWAFPKGELVNMGIGIGAGGGGELQERLEDLLRHLGLDPALAGGAKPHLVPSRPLTRIQRDRVMLAGDAAGLVNPLTGAGIEYGAESGERAASVSVLAISGGDFRDRSLARYQSLVGARLRNLRLCSRMVDAIWFLMDKKMDNPKVDGWVLRHLAPFV